MKLRIGVLLSAALLSGFAGAQQWPSKTYRVSQFPLTPFGDIRPVPPAVLSLFVTPDFEKQFPNTKWRIWVASSVTSLGSSVFRCEAKVGISSIQDDLSPPLDTYAHTEEGPAEEGSGFDFGRKCLQGAMTSLMRAARE